MEKREVLQWSNSVHLVHYLVTTEAGALVEIRTIHGGYGHVIIRMKHFTALHFFCYVSLHFLSYVSLHFTLSRVTIGTCTKQKVFGTQILLHFRTKLKQDMYCYVRGNNQQLLN